MNGMRGIERGIPFVPPFQGGGKFVGTSSRPFRPGYHIAGFQPFSISQPQRSRDPSVPARAHDELVLHMQQRFAQRYPGLNVRSCRLASRSTDTRRRHAGCPR